MNNDNFISEFDSTTVLQEIAAYLKLLPPPGQAPSTDENDKEFLLELLVCSLELVANQLDDDV